MISQYKVVSATRNLSEEFDHELGEIKHHIITVHLEHAENYRVKAVASVSYTTDKIARLICQRPLKSVWKVIDGKTVDKTNRSVLSETEFDPAVVVDIEFVESLFDSAPADVKRVYN